MTVDANISSPLTLQSDETVKSLEKKAGSLLEILAVGALLNGKIKVDVLLHGKTAPSTGVAADGGNAGDEGSGAVSGTYSATYDSIWIAEVTSVTGIYASATIEVTDGSGATIKTYTPTSAVAELIANGISFTLTDGGDTNLTQGDKWVITNVAGDIRPVQVDVDGKLVTV